MKFKCYSIFDRVTGVYGEPFYSVNEAAAVRRFDYVMGNAPMVSGDCALFEVGEFDSELGVMISLDKPVFVKNYEVTSNV